MVLPYTNGNTITPSTYKSLSCTPRLPLRLWVVSSSQQHSFGDACKIKKASHQYYSTLTLMSRLRLTDLHPARQGSHDLVMGQQKFSLLHQILQKREYNIQKRKRDVKRIFNFIFKTCDKTPLNKGQYYILLLADRLEQPANISRAYMIGFKRRPFLQERPFRAKSD